MKRGLVKIFMLMLFFSSLLLAQNQCRFDEIRVKSELEKKYAKEIKGLKKESPYYNSKEQRKKMLFCKDVPNSSKSIFVLSYYSSTKKHNENYSLIIAKIDRKKSKIENSYFHENIMIESKGHLSVEINVKEYTNLGEGFTFGLSLNKKFIYETRELIIYEEVANGLKVLSEKIMLYKLYGDDLEKSIVELKSKKSLDKKPYRPLVFERTYYYKKRKDSQKKLVEWSVKLDDLVYFNPNGNKYITPKIKPVFDLEQIEEQAKNGLHFQMIVVEAIFNATCCYPKNIPHLNKIAYYFYEHKFYKEAIYLLERLTVNEPKLAMNHLTLADAYWAIDLKMKAKNHYAMYKRINEKNAKKVFSGAMERSKTLTEIYDLNLSKGFVEVHSKKESVHPLILEKMNKVKPKAIVPWLQKKIFATSEGKLIKTFVYEKDSVLNFLYFCLVDETIKLYLFNQNGKERLIKEFNPNIFMASISNHEYQNYKIDEDGLNFFFEYYDSKRDEPFFNRHYRYSFEDERIISESIEKARTKSTIANFVNNENSNYASTGFGSDTTFISLDYGGSFSTKIFEDTFIIGDIDWSPDDRVLYFDNHGEVLACIWRYDLDSKELTKIVPEHESEHPFAFDYKGKEYVLYIEGQEIKVATENKEQKQKNPKKVKERYEQSKDSFEKGFVAVHKNIQSVSPLLFENKGVANPIAIVPWLQKKLFYVDDVNDGKIMKVIAYEQNGKIEFVYFLISTVKNEVGLVKLFGIDQEKNESFLIAKIHTNFIEKDIYSKDFPAMVQDEFLIKNETVYFLRFNNEKGDDYYQYRYDFGDTKMKDFHFTIDSARDSYAYMSYAHDDKKFAESINGQLTIGVDGDTPIEFVTQEMDGNFVIGSETWSEDDKILYFDNYGEILACIWRYDLETKELTKIVPEHEAEHPFAFTYKGKEYVVYIEGQEIKVATQ